VVPGAQPLPRQVEWQILGGHATQPVVDPGFQPLVIRIDGLHVQVAFLGFAGDKQTGGGFQLGFHALKGGMGIHDQDGGLWIDAGLQRGRHFLLAHVRQNLIKGVALTACACHQHRHLFAGATAFACAWQPPRSLARMFEIGLVHFDQSGQAGGLMTDRLFKEPVAPAQGPADGEPHHPGGFSDREALAEAVGIRRQLALVFQLGQWGQRGGAGGSGTPSTKEPLQPVLRAVSHQFAPAVRTISRLILAQGLSAVAVTLDGFHPIRDPLGLRSGQGVQPVHQSLEGHGFQGFSPLVEQERILPHSIHV